MRDNDAHTLFSLSLAAALLDERPQADPEVVLPAMMLHDIGWSQVEPGLVLSAIAPGGGRPDLVLQHEQEGARLSTEILESLGVDPLVIEQVAAIIDGHDSRTHALNPSDEIVKDADKLWRLTPHGLDTVMDWFGLHRGQALRLCASRVLGKLSTPEATVMARGLIALEQETFWPAAWDCTTGRLKTLPPIPSPLSFHRRCSPTLKGARRIRAANGKGPKNGRWKPSAGKHRDLQGPCHHGSL